MSRIDPNKVHEVEIMGDSRADFEALSLGAQKSISAFYVMMAHYVREVLERNGEALEFGNPRLLMMDDHGRGLDLITIEGSEPRHLREARARLQDSKVQAYAVISEAWTREFTSKEEAEVYMDRGLTPSRDKANSNESFVFYLESRQGERALASIKFTRNAAGLIAKLEPMHVTIPQPNTYVSYGGLFEEDGPGLSEFTLTKTQRVIH